MYDFLYVIQAIEGGPVKIGRSHNPPKRLSDLQVGNPQTLRLLFQSRFILGCIPAAGMEGYIHSSLHDERVGGEWFSGDKTDQFLSSLGIICGFVSSRFGVNDVDPPTEIDTVAPSRSTSDFTPKFSQDPSIARSAIHGALSLTNGNVSKSVEITGIPRATFYRWLDRLEIQPSDFRSST